MWNFDTVKTVRVVSPTSRGRLFDDHPAGALCRTPRETAPGGTTADTSTAARSPSLAPPVGYVGFRRQPGATHVLLRGDPKAQGPQVTPRGLSALFKVLPGDLGAATADAPEAERRRRRFARMGHRSAESARLPGSWSTGSGSFTSARDWPAITSDLGFNGGHPTHPRLLDWLASELIRSGWSLKHHASADGALSRPTGNPRPRSQQAMRLVMPITAGSGDLHAAATGGRGGSRCDAGRQR